MFGDILHGSLLLITGLYLIFWKGMKDKESVGGCASLQIPLSLQGFLVSIVGLFCGISLRYPLMYWIMLLSE